MALELESYPASKRSNLEIFEELHQGTNWYTIEHDGWHLPATDEPKEDCGKWLFKGCLNVLAHKKSDYPGKIFLKTFQKSCYRADCSKCYRKWISRQSNKATRRMEVYKKKSKEPAKHIVVSPPHWEYGKSKQELAKEAYKILKNVKGTGGAIIFHPFRYDKNLNHWYYSPHFHVVGFGWIEYTEEIYKENGWVVKNLGVRESVFSTFYYQLSHAGIKKGYHTLVWFGDLSYSKLKIEKEPDTNACPLCRAKLRPLYHHGLFGYVPPPETEVELFVEPEGWHYLEPKSFEKITSTKEDKFEFMLQRDLYYANKGVTT